MKRHLKDKRIDNTWSIIKLSDLPENLPVLAVSEFANKSFAEFHLVKYCLIPKSIHQKIYKDETETINQKENVTN